MYVRYLSIPFWANPSVTCHPPNTKRSFDSFLFASDAPFCFFNIHSPHLHLQSPQTLSYFFINAPRSAQVLPNPHGSSEAVFLLFRRLSSRQLLSARIVLFSRP